MMCDLGLKDGTKAFIKEKEGAKVGELVHLKVNKILKDSQIIKCSKYEGDEDELSAEKALNLSQIKPGQLVQAKI
jgi:hypothetical protein